MSADTPVAQAQRFRSIVARHMGLALEGVTTTALAEVLRRRAAAHGVPWATYLDRLAARPSGDEVGALARELTVGETYFYRHREQFLAFAEVALPERLRAQETQRRLSFLSVGCASGEEAYTLAMVVRGVVTDPSWQVSIIGIDINGAMVQKAEHARYSAWALRAIPHGLRQRWFSSDGQTLVLDEAIRRSVRFLERNLVDDDPQFWRPATFDAIFCRNVIMYLTPEAGRALVDRMVGSLAPGGYLFLGHAESLRGHRDDLDLWQTHDTFYYQRAPFNADGAGVSKRQPGGPDDWWAAIGAASGRVRALVADDRPRPPPSSTVVTKPDADWDRALDLLSRECFSEALAVVDALPGSVRNQPDGQVLRTVLLIQCGRIDPAEEECQRMLERNGLDAGAHYLLGLCHEGRGDQRGALRHNQMAAYLDPVFAMPRLRLGVLARRRGETEEARRELRRALALLSREDPHRLFLLAGGFSRGALIALCRAELAACGTTP
jgi:chemotaxis protein methyltransferase CheR